jgi:hypothetical protein
MLNGCIKADRQVTLASANAFIQALEAELRDSGLQGNLWGGGGQAGNVRSRELSCELPCGKLPPKKFREVAMVALAKWGQYGTYSVEGLGGGDFNFSVHFGSHRTQAFINALAYQKEDQTLIHIFVDVVE